MEMKDTKLVLWNRDRLTMEGVQEVVGLDEDGVQLTTVSGCLRIEGQALKLKTLSPELGQVIVEGKINGLFFEEAAERGGLWHRLMG